MRDAHLLSDALVPWVYGELLVQLTSGVRVVRVAERSCGSSELLAPYY